MDLQEQISSSPETSAQVDKINQIVRANVDYLCNTFGAELSTQNINVSVQSLRGDLSGSGSITDGKPSIELNVDPEANQTWVSDTVVHELTHIWKDLQGQTGKTPLSRLEGQGSTGIEFDKYGVLEEAVPIAVEIVHRRDTKTTDPPLLVPAAYTPQAAFLLTISEHLVATGQVSSQVESLRQLASAAISGDQAKMQEWGIAESLSGMYWNRILHANQTTGMIQDQLGQLGLADNFTQKLQKLYQGDTNLVDGVPVISAAKYENPIFYPSPDEIPDPRTKDFISAVKEAQENYLATLDQLVNLARQITEKISASGKEKYVCTLQECKRKREVELISGDTVLNFRTTPEYFELDISNTQLDQSLTIGWNTKGQPRYASCNLPGLSNLQILPDVTAPGKTIVVDEGRELAFPRNLSDSNPGDLIILNPIKNELQRQLEALNN